MMNGGLSAAVSGTRLPLVAALADKYGPGVLEAVGIISRSTRLNPVSKAMLEDIDTGHQIGSRCERCVGRQMSKLQHSNS